MYFKVRHTKDILNSSSEIYILLYIYSNPRKKKSKERKPVKQMNTSVYQTAFCKEKPYWWFCYCPQNLMLWEWRSYTHITNSNNVNKIRDPLPPAPPGGGWVEIKARKEESTIFYQKSFTYILPFHLPKNCFHFFQPFEDFNQWLQSQVSVFKHHSETFLL